MVRLLMVLVSLSLSPWLAGGRPLHTHPAVCPSPHQVASGPNPDSFILPL